MAVEGWFGKDARVTMELKGGGNTTEIHGSITSYSESGAKKETESIPVFGGGNIPKEMVQEDLEVTFEVVPTDLTFFEPLSGEAVTETVEVVKSTSSSAEDYRVTITWGEGFSGTPEEPNTGEALRYTFVNCNATTVECSDDADGELVATVTFKLAPTDSSGNPQIFRERTPDASATPFPDPYGDAAVRQAFDSYA